LNFTDPQHVLILFSALLKC